MDYTQLPLPHQLKQEIHQILSEANENGYEFDDDAIYRNLNELTTDDPYTQSAFAHIAISLINACLNAPNPVAALNNFSRFAMVTFSRSWLYKLLHDAPFLMPTILHVFGASTYLSEILIRNPIYLYDVIDANVMEQKKTSQCMYGELARTLNLFDDINQKLRILRRYKIRESLRIAVRDLLNTSDVETTTLEMSNLAEATLQHCYEIGRDQVIIPKFGTPLNEDGSDPCRFAVIGMGKFGGYALNYSSDIDLIFVYSDEGKTDQGIENSEYYARLCEFIINAMSEVTSDGYVFRVDIRLRPESSAGVIIRSMESYESYYEGWGDLWERQALIKARPVAGDIEFGDEFIRMIHPFVYQRYLDGVTLNEIKVDIRKTKARIEQRIVNEKTDIHKHVKLGPGGIRDIEFTVQCLQMIHGGRLKSLCTQNTLETLQSLKVNELLDPHDADTLTSAYKYLRKVENAIQIEADQQRYAIPSRENEEIQLARTVGYMDKPLDSFRHDYTEHTSEVRRIFEKVMDVQEPDQLDIPVLLSQDDSEEIQQQLGKFGFENPRDAQRLLRHLANGSDGQQFSPSVRRTFFKLAPILLNCLSKAPDPDMALRYFDAFAEKVGARSSYYTMFLERQNILEALISLCGSSLYLADLLIASPELFDLLTIPTFTESTKTLEKKINEVSHITENTSDAYLLNSLRRYKNDEIWRIALRNILGKSDLPTTTEELSDLAEAMLQSLYLKIESQTQIENGIPKTPDGKPVTFAIIAMGKFGGRDLNFSSDLDVMFVYSEDGETTKGIPNSEYFTSLGLELVNQFGGTHSMSIYELDLRLRPYGNGGAIALPLTGYQHYYDTAAEIWERQALTRARVVAGDIDGLGTEYTKLANDFCYSRPITRDEVAEIVHTRKRKEKQATRKNISKRRRSSTRTQRKSTDVKSGYGGLVDIEFAVQTLQLIHGTDADSVRVPNTLDAIDRLNTVGILTEEQSSGLSEAYKFLRRVENALRIVHDRALDALPTNQSELAQLARRLGYTDSEEPSSVEKFSQDYGMWTEKTRTLFNSLLVD